MERAENPATIVVVEDEADMARLLQFNLQSLGHRVHLAPTAADAVRLVADGVPDLVLLDLRLPDGFGMDLLRDFRAAPRTAATPVIVVSALGDEPTVVQALECGADDVVIKPFRTRELLARVATALRRHATPPEAAAGAATPLAFGPLRMAPDTREASAAGAPVELTRTEFDLLAFFVANPERVFTRRQLCEQALGSAGAILERTIDAHIRTLRRKLGPAGHCLVTVWGVGYRLVDSP